MVRLVYQVCYDTFGAKEGKTSRPSAGPSRRQRQIKEVCGELQRQRDGRKQVTRKEQLWMRSARICGKGLAKGCFVPKELNSTRLDQFREISLLDVEGKINWSIIAKRVRTFLNANEFINPSVQKGGVPGYSGCLEHTTAISQLVRETKRNNSTLSVICLYLAKGYPSVPHQLIWKALDYYRVPSEVTQLVMDHMCTLQMRFTVGNITTKWQRLEKGIMAGCTISVTLFIAAMNLLLTAAATQCRGPKAEDGTRHPACRAFVDDVIVMTPSIEGTQWILSRRFKVWCFQYRIIPRFQWPFLLYKFPLSQVEEMERLCSKFLRKFFFHPFRTINLYSKTSKLPLPVSSVV